MRDLRSRLWLAFTVLLVASFALPVSAGSLSVVATNAWVGKVYEYANPFDPNLDRSVAETTIAISNGWAGSAGNAVTRSCPRSPGVSARLTKAGSGTPGPATYANYTAPSAFRAKTVIVTHGVWSGFTSPQPFTLKFGASPSPAWASIAPAASGPGTVAFYNLIVTNCNGWGDQMRLDYSESSLFGATFYTDMDQIVVLPHNMVRIPVTATATLSTWGVPANLVDLMESGDGWAAQDSGVAQKTLTFTFSTVRRVNAIVVYSFENADAIFTIRDSANNPVARVTMAMGPSGWALPIRFDQALSGTSVKFDFGTPDTGLREVIFFEDVPATGTVITVQ